MDSEKRTGAIAQFVIYLQKCFTSFKNEGGWKSFISVLIIAVLIACVLGDNIFKSYSDTQNGAFALVCACLWVGVFSSIRSICRERDILKHEHRTGLRMGSYVMAHWVYELILSLVDALIITVIVYVATIKQFPKSGVFLPSLVEMYITFFLVVFSADALGLLISSIVHTENMAMTVMPFALIIQLAMSGAIFDLEEKAAGIPALISNLTISRWGLDAICSISNVNHMWDRLASSNIPTADTVSDVPTLLTLWGILVLFAVAYAVISIVVLALTIDR